MAIQPIQQIEIPETASVRTYIAPQNVIVIGNYLYFVSHNGYLGAPNTLVKFDLTNFTYQTLNLGSGFTSGAPMVYIQGYLLIACGLSNYRQVRFFVVDIDTLSIVRTFTYTHPYPSGVWASPHRMFIRSDGGINLIIGCRNFLHSSDGNHYCTNFAPFDILIENPTPTAEFEIGTRGYFGKMANGVFLYHPVQRQALTNRDNFRFLLHTTDETLQTWQYGDGTPAPIPFNPETADYSKVNSVLDIIRNTVIQNLYVNGTYYTAGKNINNYEGYEFYDDNFNIVDSWVGVQAKSYLRFYGSTEYLLFHQLIKQQYGILKLMRISDKQMIDISGTYSRDIGTIQQYSTPDYFFLIDVKEDYSIGRITIFNASDMSIFRPIPKYLYPFWY